MASLSSPSGIEFASDTSERSKMKIMSEFLAADINMSAANALCKRSFMWNIAVQKHESDEGKAAAETAKAMESLETYRIRIAGNEAGTTSDMGRRGA